VPFSSVFLTINGLVIATTAVAGLVAIVVLLTICVAPLEYLMRKWMMRSAVGLLYFAAIALSTSALVSTASIPQAVGNLSILIPPFSLRSQYAQFVCSNNKIQIGGLLCSGDTISCSLLWETFSFSCDVNNLNTVSYEVSSGAGWWWQLAALIAVLICFLVFLTMEHRMFTRIPPAPPIQKSETSAVSVNQSETEFSRVNDEE